MEYIIKDVNGEEHGPIDAETLAKWVDEDRVLAETQVRSSLMANWKNAEHVAFLAERFAEQELRRQKSATMAEKSGSILKKAKSRLSDKLTPKVQSTFEQKRPPQYAQMKIRFMAGLYDLVLIMLIGIFLYGIGISYAYFHTANTDSSKQEIAEKDNMMIPVLKAERDRRIEIEGRFEAVRKVQKGEELEASIKAFKAEFKAEKAKSKEIREELHENNMTADCPPYTLADKNAGYQASSIWLDTVTGEKYICLSGKAGAARWLANKDFTKIVTICLSAMVLIVLFLYAFWLAYYSQTFGMWFWGIFITKRKIGEVYFFRAFIFTLLYPCCFIFSPLFVYIFRRGLHEILSGTRFVRVFSNKNA
ncbi:MAG: RDD family protein [Victivallales bacterium]|nr:RDD family protein [Victivallales bacterium]